MNKLINSTLLALSAPLVPLFITLYYYNYHYDRFIQHNLEDQLKPENIIELYLLLVPVHTILLYLLSDTTPLSWVISGLIIGLYQAYLGRYYFDLPGKLWLLDNPDQIFIVAPIIWIFIYLFLYRAIFQKLH